MGELKKFSQPQRVRNEMLLAERSAKRHGRILLIVMLIALALLFGAAFGEVIIHHAMYWLAGLAA